MKTGMDIASLAYKRQVDQVVLIAGDSDFVPAAKLARREGLDFVLDPMEMEIGKDRDLFEHIDGKRSCGNPYKRERNAEENNQLTCPYIVKNANNTTKERLHRRSFVMPL